MNRIAKLVLLVSLVQAFSMCQAQAAATIIWQTGPGATDYLTQLGGGSRITGNGTVAPAGTVGGFLQLIYIGTSYDGFVDSGTGVLGDDAVVATAYVGLGAMGADGRFLASSGNSYASGSQFIIRFFDTPSGTYGSGLVPTSGYYGISGVFTTTQDPTGTGSDTFNISGPVTTVVPEPTTVALMIAGLGILAGRRFLRS